VIQAPRELALPLAQACADTYAPGTQPQWQDNVRLVHVYLSLVNGVHTVAFEGTTDWQEWVFSDFMVGQLILPEYVECGAIHVGFARDVLAVLKPIQEYLASVGNPPYYATGHSKGASESILFAAFMKKSGFPPAATWAFEPARCGGQALLDYLSDIPLSWTRTTNAEGDDLVTRVPFGPSWREIPDPLVLEVPASDDLAQKHRIPAVIAGLSQSATPSAPTPQ